ncbi:MAG: type III pantothenate kinase [Bacteroidales bacterium]|jgi:type III pantothenate kinase|nr:type III pantothenate kinase [Bacteroidales bacterium]
MNLVIDIGNTLQKIAVFDEKEQLIYMEAVTVILMDKLQEIVHHYCVQKSIISKVGLVDPETIHFLKNNTEYIHFDNRSRIPISIGYHTPETLGLDRIACSVAAASIFPNQNCLSIQLGSCIVYDFVNNQNVYVGGAISPGLLMRFKSLHQFTAQLPLVDLDHIDYFMGQNTQQSIKSGVINGAVFEIDGQIEAYKSQFSDVKVLLTGGDLPYLQKSIKNQIFATPNLVLVGLNKILNLNV